MHRLDAGEDGIQERLEVARASPQPDEQAVDLGARVEERSGGAGGGRLAQRRQQRLRGGRPAIGPLGEQCLEEPCARERGGRQGRQLAGQDRSQQPSGVGRPALRAGELGVQDGDIAHRPEALLGPGHRVLRPLPLPEAEAHAQLVGGRDGRQRGGAPAVGEPARHPVEAVQGRAPLWRVVEGDDGLPGAGEPLHLDVDRPVHDLEREAGPGRRLLGLQHEEGGPAGEHVGVRQAGQPVPAAPRREHDGLLRRDPGAREVVLRHQRARDEVRAVHLDRRQLGRAGELRGAAQVLAGGLVAALEEAEGPAVGQHQEPQVRVEVGREVCGTGPADQLTGAGVRQVGGQAVPVQDGCPAQRRHPRVLAVVRPGRERRQGLVRVGEVPLVDGHEGPVHEHGGAVVPGGNEVDGAAHHRAGPRQQQPEPLRVQDPLDERHVTGGGRVHQRIRGLVLVEEPLGGEALEAAQLCRVAPPERREEVGPQQRVVAEPGAGVVQRHDEGVA